MTTPSLTIVRTLAARPERVFAAWTRPELMARWFFPDASWTAVASADLTVGGRYEVAMREPSGREHLQFGEYREIVPASRLVFTWTCPEVGVADSVVTVALVARGARTELTLTHDLPPDPKIREAHEHGWIGCLGNLAAFTNDPETRS